MGLPSLLSAIKLTRYTTAASEMKAPLRGMGKFYIMITWVLPGFFFVWLFVCFAFCYFMPMAHFKVLVGCVFLFWTGVMWATFTLPVGWGSQLDLHFSLNVHYGETKTKVINCSCNEPMWPWKFAINLDLLNCVQEPAYFMEIWCFWPVIFPIPLTLWFGRWNSK